MARTESREPVTGTPTRETESRSLGLSLAGEIATFGRRLNELRGASASPDVSREVLLDESLAELSTSVEELEVVEVELLEQNRRLAIAQAVAEEERRRYQELFMTAPYGMLLTSLRGVIQEANHAAAALLGLDVDHASGKPLSLFVQLAQRDQFQRRVREAAASAASAPPSEEEFALHSFGRGREFPCRMTVTRADAGALGEGALRWTLLDMTDRERARDRDRLEAQSVRKDEFLATLGHELRNPLAAIALAAELLKVHPGGGPRRPTGRSR